MLGAAVSSARDDGMPAVAVTDFMNLFAWVKFYKKAVASGVKPIIGSDIVVFNDGNASRVTLLCQNDQGYLNLTELITKAYLEGQSRTGVPEIQWSWLSENASGLIALSGGRQGDVGKALLSGNFDDAESHARRWCDVFGDRYYIELIRTGRENESAYLEKAVVLASDLGLPVVATNDVCFLASEDYEAHEARVCIQSGYCLNDPKRPRAYSSSQYFKSQAQMVELFSDIPSALENTLQIARRCNVKLELGKVCLPNFPVPEGVALGDFLRQESQRGLESYMATPAGANIKVDDYNKRLDIELDVINRMGFPGYFLIVADFIRWAKENDIPVGPGRGSGAGSLVAFCLGTNYVGSDSASFTLRAVS